MKKITYLIFSLILLIVINGCAGYKPIFSSTNVQFEISDYSLEGNKILGNKIYLKLHNLSKAKRKSQDIRNISLLINVSENKNATVKDSTGKILEYKITLNVKVEIKDFLTEDNILNETFVSSTSYKVQDQYSETVNLENSSVKNLIENTYQKLLIKLSENIITK